MLSQPIGSGRCSKTARRWHSRTGPLSRRPAPEWPPLEGDSDAHKLRNVDVRIKDPMSPTLLGGWMIVVDGSLGFTDSTARRGTEFQTATITRGLHLAPHYEAATPGQGSSGQEPGLFESLKGPTILP